MSHTRTSSRHLQAKQLTENEMSTYSCSRGCQHISRASGEQPALEERPKNNETPGSHSRQSRQNWTPALQGPKSGGDTLGTNRAMSTVQHGAPSGAPWSAASSTGTCPTGRGKANLISGKITAEMTIHSYWQQPLTSPKNILGYMYMCACSMYVCICMYTAMCVYTAKCTRISGEFLPITERLRVLGTSVSCVRCLLAFPL